MSRVATRSAEYKDLFELPENMVGQIINGVLHAHPRPAPAHAHATSTLGMDIGSCYQRGRGGPGGWWIVDEPELHLGRQVLVPNLAGWRGERLPTLPRTAWFALPPDWVCEVLSASTARIDRTEKLPVFAEYGVACCWIVDPTAYTLEVLVLIDGQWRIDSTWSGEDEVCAAPFAEIHLELGALWLPE